MFLVHSVGVYRIASIVLMFCFIEAMGGVVFDRNDLSVDFMMNFGSVAIAFS